jgi:hypothetical protein
VDIRYEAKRPKATDIHAALAEWFPAGYSRTRPEFEKAIAAAATSAGEEAAGKLPWGELGRRVADMKLEVEGEPRLELRHVKLAEAPQWAKVSGLGAGRSHLNCGLCEGKGWSFGGAAVLSCFRACV